MRKKKNKLSDEKFYELADFFKIFGDSTRLKILNLLLAGQKNVTMLCEKTNMTKSAISHQLRTLKNARIIKYVKDGKSVIYEMADEHISQIMKIGIEHILEL